MNRNSSQDKYLLQAHNRLQGMGVPHIGLTSVDYRKKLTSLSLVNKQNLDVDIQIADNLAIMANIVYMTKLGIKTGLSETESIFKVIIDKKMTAKENPSIFEVLV